MGKIQMVAVHVEGDNAAITEALKIFTNVLDAAIGQPLKTATDFLNPQAIAPPSPTPPEPASRPARRASTRAPVAQKSNEREFFCPVKNCAKSFKMKAWRDKHLKEKHGIEEPV